MGVPGCKGDCWVWFFSSPILCPLCFIETSKSVAAPVEVKTAAAAAAAASVYLSFAAVALHFNLVHQLSKNDRASTSRSRK